jgi:hypothetical protein
MARDTLRVRFVIHRRLHVDQPLSPRTFAALPLRARRTSTVGKLTGSVLGKSRL